MIGTYELLKALHVAAAATWVGGMTIVAALARGADAGQAAALRRASLRFVTPAMLAALALGVGLGVAGGWFRAPWLAAKLVVVIVLTGLHGALSGRLRRLAEGRGPTAEARWLPFVVPALLAAVAWLAIAKPGAW